MTVAGQTTKFQQSADIGWLFLDRPKEFNSINTQMLDEIEQFLDLIESGSSDLRVLVITGEGKAFSSGVDLKLVSKNAETALAVLERAQSVWLRIAELELPVIAAVNGIALAGGMELALAADIITASTDARMGDGHLNVGLVPGIGGASHLSRRLPLAAAKDMVLTGDSVTASRLHELGLISHVWNAEDLIGKTNELAARIAAKSPLAVRETLKIMDKSSSEGLNRAEGFALELEANRELSQHADFSEGVRAFLEKRKPNFTGK